MPFLEVNNLRKSFQNPSGRKVVALNGVSFSLEQGEILAVVGHNGSGKTTLLDCIRRAFPWDDGNIKINGVAQSDSSIPVVSVFQDVEMGVVGSMTAMENLSLVYSGQPNYYWSFPLRKFRSSIHEFLNQAGLLDRFEAFEDTPMSDLSGGQRQQVAIVMAMMRNPSVLLLDEFVANLDPVVRDDILGWTRRWIREHRITTLMVTHDHSIAESWGDWVLELSDGESIRLVASHDTSKYRSK